MKKSGGGRLGCREWRREDFDGADTDREWMTEVAQDVGVGTATKKEVLAGRMRYSCMDPYTTSGRTFQNMSRSSS